MINLLPQEKKHKNIMLFRQNAVSVLFFTLTVAVLLSAISLLPVYFVSSVRESIEQEKLVLFEQRPEVTESGVLAETIKSTNEKLEIFSETEVPTLMRNVISPLIAIEQEGITIEGFLLNQPTKEGEGYTGEINGLASSREALLEFSSKIEATGNFSSVDVPISQYAKGKDIDYSITFQIVENKNI